MGEDGLDLGQLDPLAGDQVGADGVVVLADDRHRVGFEGQGVEGRADRALDRVLDRDQGAVGLAGLDGEDRLGDRRRAQRLEAAIGDGLAERVLGEGSGRAEVGDAHRCAYSKVTV